MKVYVHYPGSAQILHARFQQIQLPNNGTFAKQMAIYVYIFDFSDTNRDKTVRSELGNHRI